MCCGTGAALRHLRRVCRDRVVGIDISRGMLEVARQMMQKAPGDARIDLVHGHVLAMSFTATFDVAVCFGAFGHIIPQERAPFIYSLTFLLPKPSRCCASMALP